MWQLLRDSAAAEKSSFVISVSISGSFGLIASQFSSSVNWHLSWTVSQTWKQTKSQHVAQSKVDCVQTEEPMEEKARCTPSWPRGAPYKHAETNDIESKHNIILHHCFSHWLTLAAKGSNLNPGLGIPM